MSGYTPASSASPVNTAGEIYDAENDLALILRDGPHKLLGTGDELAASLETQTHSRKLPVFEQMDKAPVTDKA